MDKKIKSGVLGKILSTCLKQGDEMTRIKGFATIIAVYASVSSPYVFAQTWNELDEIMTTAQKREENQQNVPIALTVLSDAFISSNDVQTLEDLNGSVSNFVTTRSVSYGAAPLSIRGIGGANGGGNFYNDEPVSVYVDGVYVARLSVSTAYLTDIESIQVLRGPQGTMYGRNSTAGAILLTTKGSDGKNKGEFRASASDLGDYRAQGAISGPLSDNLAGRVAVGYSDRNGFGENIVDGSTPGGAQTLAGRGHLSFSPRDSIRFNLIAEYQNREANPALIAITDVGLTGSASPFVVRPDLNDVLKNNEYSLNDDNFENSTSYTFTLNSEIDLGPIKVTSISGYRDWSLDGAQDSDSTALQLFTNSGQIASEQFSQELRLSSNIGTPLKWVVGAYFLNESTAVDFDIQNFQGLFGLGTDAAFSGFQDTQAYAVFADGTYALNERLSLTLGGRYSHEDKDFTNDMSVSVLTGGTLPSFFLNGATLPAGSTFSDPPQFKDSENFGDFSPRAIVDFQLSPNVLLYSSYSQGFKSGGFNSFGLTPAFESENIESYEAGFKTEFADKSLRINGSAFSYDYSNLQIRLPVPTGGVDIQNVGEAKIRGLEIETHAKLSRGLMLSANMSLLDAQIQEGMISTVSSTVGSFPIGAPLPIVTENTEGNRLTRAPEFSGFFNVRYEKLIGQLKGAVSATLKHQSGVHFLETNQDSQTFGNEAWEEVDIRATISEPKDNWELALFGKNILNNRHITAVTALGGFPNAAVNEPAKWGVEFLVSY